MWISMLEAKFGKESVSVQENSRQRENEQYLALFSSFLGMSSRILRFEKARFFLFQVQ